MYYPDLTCYRIDSVDNQISIVYPTLINIGWLSSRFNYEKGDIPNTLIQKLKEILFIHLKNSEDQKKEIFDQDKAIIVHENFTRGSAHECEFCQENKKIFVEPSGLEYYSGNDLFLLGRNEIIIPGLEKNRFYVLPTMIYHYILAHQYKPPQEFLDALESFDLNRPFNINNEYSSLFPIKIPEGEVNDFIFERDASKYEKYEEYDDDDDDDD